MARNRNEHETARCAHISLFSIATISFVLTYVALDFLFSPIIFRSSNYGRPIRAGVQDKDDYCCNGAENLELWGSAVKWGTDLKLNSSKDCCRACKDLCNGSGTCLCNSWVFCEDREKCGHHFGECWLKKQLDVLNPEIKESGNNVIWTSGLIFGKGEGIIAFETKYGKIHIKLSPDCAPHSVAYILELLKNRLCAGCHFYRAEGRGSSWDSEGNHIPDAPFGPPFALIQGTLQAHGTPFKEIPKEACPSIERGSVAWVGSGPEFFISLAKHEEWRKAYTVFGSVLPEDMEIVEKIAQLPTTKDAWNNFEVAVLENPLSFSLKRVTKDP